MGLSAREQQSLNSIESRLTGSDPELAALLSMFTWLASDDKMPDRETVPAGPRPTLRSLRPARSRSSSRRVRRHLGFQWATLLSLWVLTAAALIAVMLVLSTSGDHGSTCTELVATTTCADPASGQSPAASSPKATASQAPQRRTADIPQAGP